MARRYNRDKVGRFSGGGGGGIGSKSKGGKMGKSSKNTKARAKYKESQRKVKDAQGMKKVAASSRGGSKSAGGKFASRQVAGSKSGATRVKRGLQGGKKNLQGSFKGLSKSAAKTKTRQSSATAKKALVRKVSNKALKGQKISSQQARYVRSQQQEKMRIEKSGGKGSKAKRRAAKRR
jgi:hypothetical protein|tara:strand:+ start:148 stop:681 length:534 start_codon:yes stop_codon:yes gene_type:complete